MRTQLSLSIKKEVAETAKAYAEINGQSLSNLVENYLKLLTSKRKNIDPNDLSPRVKRLRGIIKIDKQLDPKKILDEERSKKYKP